MGFFSRRRSQAETEARSRELAAVDPRFTIIDALDLAIAHEWHGSGGYHHHGPLEDYLVRRRAEHKRGMHPVHLSAYQSGSGRAAAELDALHAREERERMSTIMHTPRLSDEQLRREYQLSGGEAGLGVTFARFAVARRAMEGEPQAAAPTPADQHQAARPEGKVPWLASGLAEQDPIGERYTDCTPPVIVGEDDQ